MTIRRLIPIAIIAAIGAPLIAQVAPRDAAKAFTIDGIMPTPAATPTPVPTPDVVPPAYVGPAVEAAPAPAPPAATAAPLIATPTVPQTAGVSASPPPPAPEAVASTPSSAVRVVFTLDTPIQDLIANPGAKAVLDKDLPGVSDDENIDKFKALSLRAFQPMTGGQMTDAMLAKVAADLDVLGGGTGQVVAPIRVGSRKRSKDDSR